MNILLLLPVAIPFFTAILCIFFWYKRHLQQVLNLTGSFLLLISVIMLGFDVYNNGILAAQMGNWAAPFGITFVADLLSVMMLVLTGIIGFSVAIASIADIDPPRERYGYYPLYQILLMGICGSFLTGDIFNLFVWFEVMLIASFVLIALGSEKAQLEGAIKYVTINLVSSVFFLTAVGMLYGLAGTLNMADLALRIPFIEHKGLVTIIAMLFLVSFGIKAAVFPLFFWLPASYHTPPVAISAIFAGMLTKVGVYALIRIFTLIFVNNIVYTHSIILVIAGFTMIVGVLGAIVQTDFRRILSFNLVSHIGYMIMGLALFTPLALAGSVFYVAHHILVKSNLFLVSGVVRNIKGSFDLTRLGGIYKSYPFLSVLYIIPALSLSGIPPFSGFWGKLFLIKASFDKTEYVIAIAALVAGILTLYSMIKIWSEAFWRKEPPEEDNADINRYSKLPMINKIGILFPIILLTSLSLFIGFWAEPLFQFAMKTSEQLLNPTEYIDVVLGGSR
ncbi:MAG: Na+/H+ antiporter subunit D [Bacteroidia bacterium]